VHLQSRICSSEKRLQLNTSKFGKEKEQRTSNKLKQSSPQSKEG